MLNGRDTNVTVDKGCRECCITDILGFGGNFNHGIEVATTKNNTCIRLRWMQRQLDFIAGVETHAGGTYDIF
jgi:hypothetical protein